MHQFGPIVVPHFEEFIDEITPLERDTQSSCLEVAEALIPLIKKLDGLPATPMRVAWLALFSRNWNAIQTALILGPRMIPQIGDLLRRQQFELMLDLSLIHGVSGILTHFTSKFGRDVSPEVVNDRLCGYLAFCIYQDLEFYRRRRHPSRLDEIYNPSVAGRIKSSEGLSWLMEQIWGPSIDIPDSDQELENRKQERAFLHNKVNELLDLLEGDSDLSRWYQYILQAVNQGRYTFAELIDPDLKSIGKTTRRLLANVHWVDYQWTSAALHGKSFESLILGDSSAVAPHWMFWRHEEEITFDGIARLGHQNTIRLKSLLEDL